MNNKDEYLTIIRENGEFDFEVYSKIEDLSLEEYDKLRSMLIVAIGTMEEMWRSQTTDIKTISNKKVIWKNSEVEDE